MASVSTLLIITFFGINVILLELLVTRYRREIFNPGNSIAVASQAQQERCAVSISIYKISLSYFLSYFILFKFNMWVGNSTLILFLFSSLFLVILGVSFRPSYIPYLQAGQFNYTSFIFIILQLIFSCGLFISNLISFLLFLEVVSACYYFFFLTTQTIGQKQIIFFKNLFILYLFVSYLTMLSFSLGIALLSYSLGTCMFAELRLFAYTNTIGYWILLSSLGLKIGVPYFHFFKLELYQMLGFESLILFSIFSLYFNIFLYYFLCGVYLSLVAVNILGVVLLIGVGLLLSVRQFTSFAQFIAISGIITSITLLLFISLNQLVSSLLKLQRKYPKFNYLLLIRNHHIKRLHLRPYLSFLNRQYTLTQLFTNQLSVGGGFLKLYKFIRFNFIQLLRVNLIRPKGVADAYVFKNSDLSLFYSIFTTQHHLYNVDRFLLWRLTHPNSLFGLLFTVKRRKHK